MSESEDEYSSISYVPSDLNESSDGNTSNSETENENLQTVVVDTIDNVFDTADNVQSNEDILIKGRKRIRDETKWKWNI